MRQAFAALFVIALSTAPACAQDFLFRDGDVVVMIGDSITEQHLYSNYVEMWTVTRFPHWKLTFRNTGIGGDTSPGGNGRFDRDVLAYHPTAMTVDFGMNDGGYGRFDKGRFKSYMDGLQGMAHKARQAHLRAAWITPQPLDTGDQGKTALTGYNKTLEEFSAGVAKIAAENDGLFVDQFHPYLHVLDKARTSMSRYQRITEGDAVHPGPPGQALMAASILKGLHFPPLVSSLAIDATTQTVISSRGCKVREVSSKEGGVRFERHDLALPFFPPEAAGILKWAPILEELNDYRLQITGLNEGKYAVRVGGTKVTELDAVELAKGVNLAAAVLARGPIHDQVHAVKSAVENKNRYHHDRIFRGVVLSPVPDWLALSPEAIAQHRRSAIHDRMGQLTNYDAAVQKALTTKSLAFEVTPVK